MKLEEWIEKYHHEIAGMVLNAASFAREGPLLSKFHRSIMTRIDEILTSAFRDAQPPLPMLPVIAPKPPAPPAHPRPGGH